MSKRVFVYIDGFNMYYRRLKSSKTKWTDLKTLAEYLVGPEDNVQKIRYFTADVSPRAGDPDAPNRQATYFRALRTLPELSIHKGQFLAKTKRRPLLGQERSIVVVHDTEEKGSDVTLASNLLMDAFKDLYDVALVFSQDTDLIEPLRMVSEDLKKEIWVVWMDRSLPGKRHKKVAARILQLKDEHLKHAQFPNPVIGKGGAKIFRPKEWDFPPA